VPTATQLVSNSRVPPSLEGRKHRITPRATSRLPCWKGAPYDLRETPSHSCLNRLVLHGQRGGTEIGISCKCVHQNVEGCPDSSRIAMQMYRLTPATQTSYAMGRHPSIFHFKPGTDPESISSSAALMLRNSHTYHLHSYSSRRRLTIGMCAIRRAIHRRKNGSSAHKAPRLCTARKSTPIFASYALLR
jgi:hypothetical protein